MRGVVVSRSAVACLTLALLTLALLWPPPVGAATALAPAADAGPSVTLSRQEAGKGGEIMVKGAGWRPKALLMMLICGQSAPGRGVVGGTNSCANSEGRAVTTDAKGAFAKELPVAEPPKPCPCVVHVATVTGRQAAVDAVFTVAGHPKAPLPDAAGAGRLAVLATARLEGSSGVLTWFGAPPTRRLVFTVGNLGTAPVKDPVFQLGTSHGVFAPQWEERQWRGTIAPGKRALIELDVQLAAGAHGDYQVSLKYGAKTAVEQPWRVGRPWGVTLFWILLCVVVPAAVFRVGLAVVDRVRPRPGTPRPGAPGPSAPRPAAPAGGRHRSALRRLPGLPAIAPRFRKDGGPAPVPTPAPSPSASATASLPWFTADSAPSEKRSEKPSEPATPGAPKAPTEKGHS